MEGVTLTVADLVTVFGPMVATLLAIVFALMRYQHVDSAKTRELMHKLIADSSRENREHAEKLNQETRDFIKETNQETRELIEKNHQELSGGLNEVRSGLSALGERVSKLGERVARIEGYLKLWPSPPSPPEDGDPQAA